MSENYPEEYPFPTLPDYLAMGMDLLFIGINPAVYAVQCGHYFARPTNRFWPAFSRSELSEPVRKALGRDVLRSEDDATLLSFGIGFTDVVKIPTRNAAELSKDDYREWSPRLLARLDEYKPRVACFHGVTGFREFARYVLGETNGRYSPGPQAHRLGETLLYMVPNPSGANAHSNIANQVHHYDQLAIFLRGLRDTPVGR